ncbi:MAG: protein-L-isoaspartate(D-aspartate) O-methyltransferase [Bryobacterales bacterium]|nr:protein-L-isoaspartate(D-aspartate) O-methyltransferase [Bryobacterales bacterium]
MTKARPEIDWEAKRRDMVARQIEARGIRDPRVLEAMRRIPRELFIPEEHRRFACDDEPVSIGFGQTASQPYMTALMAECLELQGSETVLEVGAGCGYHAAVLGALAAQVIAVEIVPELAEMASRTLREQRRDGNIRVLCGDGSRGWPPLAPYDAISVAAAAPAEPAELLEQLRDPGVLVIPVGSIWEQELRVVTKRQGRVQTRVATFCRFVPLRGPGGWP